MISYQTEGIDMPAIKKRETTAWIKAVADTYGKKVGEIETVGRFVHQPGHGTHQRRTVQCAV